MPEEKLSLAQVLHRFIDMLGLHADTLKNAHQLVDDHVATPEEVAERSRNPFADRPDAEVIDAAVAGDQDAQAEYRARKEAQATAAAQTPPPATGA